MENGLTYIDGGVCAPAGVKAAGVHAGFRKNPERLDVALVAVEGPATCSAGMFTKNIFCAAPVQVSRELAPSGTQRAVILNSGNANASTGEPGLEVARRSGALVAQGLGLDASEVFVASTGVIGVQQDFAPYEEGVPALVAALAPGAAAAHDAACAIMTTDTHPKECAVAFELGGRQCHIGGMCKGSGMIQPNMATMLAVLTTDCAIERTAARTALKAAVDASFNKVTVDSDTSTNDSVFFLASGAAENAPIVFDTPEVATFTAALKAVCENLARQIAADGEGATKLVTVNVTGAATEADAEAAARTIANSPLVKTAIAGHDCNWGRIAAAAGRSGAAFQQEHVDIDILGMPVLRQGLPCGFSEDEALKRFEENDEVVIDVALGAGSGAARIWTCDLTHEYIHINADYRS